MKHIVLYEIIWERTQYVLNNPLTVHIQKLDDKYVIDFGFLGIYIKESNVDVAINLFYQTFHRLWQVIPMLHHTIPLKMNILSFVKEVNQIKM